MKELEALYFPYASIKDTVFLKTALLYFDRLWVISSYYASKKDVDGEFVKIMDDNDNIVDEDADNEFVELLRDEELVRWLHGDALAMEYQPILMNAIETDLSDSGFLKLTQDPRREWEIYKDKGFDQVKPLLTPLREKGNKVVVPYEQGEAFLLNLALIAASDPAQRFAPRLALLTDHEEHFSILQYKLRRGAKSQLERLYRDSLEMTQIEALISLIGRELVRAVLPAPEQVRDIPLAKIKDFRNRYREDRDKLRDRLFLMLDEILGDEPTTPLPRLKMRLEAIVNAERRQLEYDREWSSRVIGGLRALLGVTKAGAGVLQTALTGVPIQLALAGGASDAGENVLNYIEEQRSQLRTSDVTYLYRIRGTFSQ